MSAYARQVGWDRKMKYSWLFPIAFLWRHFSNPDFWEALQKNGAVPVNKRPNFNAIEDTMRVFYAHK
eukprot:3381509-Karenia_brevis.AAC.1